MSEPARPSAREALIVWLKLLAILVGVAAFGIVIFAMRRAIG